MKDLCSNKIKAHSLKEEDFNICCFNQSTYERYYGKNGVGYFGTLCTKYDLKNAFCYCSWLEVEALVKNCKCFSKVLPRV